VPAHAELAWILNNYVTVGELSRMTQYKDKSQKLGPEGQLAGLFDYPVLMAADILLYDADEVPVGEDQKQHIELARDIATRFNNLYGDTFTVPNPSIQKAGARIMNLQDPTRKMSKSDSDLSGVILLTDDAATITSKVKRAVTDSGSTVELSDDKPAISNLLTIYSLVSSESVEVLQERYAGRGYGDFKAELAEAIISKLAPVQEAFASYDQDKLNTILAEGAQQASEVANAKLAAVKAKIGLL
jgi:tryptophanyl-tRNA synthetase